MTKYDTQTPYCASYLIFRRDNLVAFVLRENTSWMNGYYGLPSGKVEKNEKFSDCAIREAREEIGISLKKDQIKYVLTVHRKAEDVWVDVYFEVIDWEGELINNEPEIHSELAWLDLNNLPDNVIPDVQDALATYVRSQKFSEFGW